MNISLVNLIVGRELVRELIQSDLTPDKLREELQMVIEGPRREDQLKTYRLIKQQLGTGISSEISAELIVNDLRDSTKRPEVS